MLKHLKANQKALELFKAKVNAAVDSVIVQLNKYGNICDDEHLKELKATLSQKKLPLWLNTGAVPLVRQRCCHHHWTTTRLLNLKAQIFKINSNLINS